MRKFIAVLTLGAALWFGATQLAEGQTDGTAVPQASGAVCSNIKQVYSEHNYRESDPAKGVTVCPAPKSVVRNTIRHFREYKEYRRIATMKCLPGREGWFVPNPGSCTTLENESGLSWWAVNSDSGAEWVYQLLGDHSIPYRYAKFLHTSTVINGGPRPDSFHNRLINHVIAAQLSRSAWTASG